MSKLPASQLRIIGGQWRSRRLAFPSIDGLRPTMDRVRETVFNWLQFDVEGAQVLDAFAGSGALGFEALSRGARHVTFLEKHPSASKQLLDNLSILKASNASVHTGDAIQWLNTQEHDFDLVFLDPPFHQQLLQPALNALKLKAGALVYVEHELGIMPIWPNNWQERKHKTTKEFSFRLFAVLPS